MGRELTAAYVERRPSPRTMRSAFAICCALLAATAGCTPNDPPAVPLANRAFRLGGEAWSLPVPQGARVDTASDGSLAIQFAPATRSSPTMRLAPGPHLASPLPHSERLDSGATLLYRTVVDEAVGSGGKEAALHGILTYPGHQSVAVTCTVQDEQPDPTWCVAYLQHLRPAG